MSTLEPAKAFAVRLNDLLCEHDRGHTIDTGEEEAAKLIEARDNAVRVALLEEIRLGANEHLRGKGLSMSPAEAVANAYQDAAIKYTQPKEST